MSLGADGGCGMPGGAVGGAVGGAAAGGVTGCVCCVPGWVLDSAAPQAVASTRLTPASVASLDIQPPHGLRYPANLVRERQRPLSVGSDFAHEAEKTD